MSLPAPHTLDLAFQLAHLRFLQEAVQTLQLPLPTHSLLSCLENAFSRTAADQLVVSGAVSGRRTNVDVALGDTGQVGSCATQGLSELLDSCLVQLTGIERRYGSSKLDLCLCITASFRSGPGKGTQSNISVVQMLAGSLSQAECSGRQAMPVHSHRPGQRNGGGTARVLPVVSLGKANPPAAPAPRSTQASTVHTTTLHDTMPNALLWVFDGGARAKV